MDAETIFHPEWRISLSEDVRLTKRDGEDANLPLRKVRAIVAILACTPGCRVARRDLIALLWSDRGIEQARASLRQCLFTLRSEAPALVEADSESVWLTGEAALFSEGCKSQATLARLAGLDPALDGWLAERRGCAAVITPTTLPAAGVGAVDTLRRTSLLVGAAIAGSILLAAAAAWWAHRRLPDPAPGLTVIAIMPFKAAPDSGEVAAVAQQMGDDMRALLPADRAVVRMTDGFGERYAPNRLAPDWVISGRADARDGAGKVHIQIATADGRQIWSRDSDSTPGHLAAAAAIAATRTAMAAGCALGGPRVHRDADVLGLLFTACDRLDASADDYRDETALVALQRLADRAPGDALAQAYFGTGLALTAYDMPPAIARAQRIESVRRLDDAQRLDPRVGEAWLGRFELVEDDHAYALQKRLLARGLQVEPNNPMLNLFMGELLVSVGRADEGLVFEQRAMAFAPAFLATTQNVARTLSGLDRPREALALLDSADRHFPNNARQAMQRLDTLLTSGDTKAARALLARAPGIAGFLEPEREAAIRRLTYAMDAPHGALADAVARDAIAEADAKPDLAEQNFNVLVQLGRTDAAVALALRHELPTDVFFRLQARPVLLNPQFPIIARRAGLWDYWQRTGHWPDVCREPQLSWRCGAGVKSTSFPK